MSLSLSRGQFVRGAAVPAAVPTISGRLKAGAATHARKALIDIAQAGNVRQSLLLTGGPEGKNRVRAKTCHAFALFKPHRANTALKAETGESSPLGLSVSASRKDRDRRSWLRLR